MSNIAADKTGNDWLDNHSHLFDVKPIDVDDILYLPGTYDNHINEDWAIVYNEYGGEG